MGEKMRVYELAQKLGLDNKVLLERLKAEGIDAKNHLSVLDAAVVERFDSGEIIAAPETGEVVEEKIEEQRITPGIIRRRRKEVPAATTMEKKAPAKKPEAVSDANVTDLDESEESKIAAEPETVARDASPESAADVEPAASKTKDAPDSDQVVVEPPQKPAAKPPGKVDASSETEVPGEKTIEKVPASADALTDSDTMQEATALQAKILGRVELSRLSPSKPETESPTRQRIEKPAAAPRAKPRPIEIAAPEALVPQEEISRNHKKKKIKSTGLRDHDVRDGGRGRRPKREIFEPDMERRQRRGKKAPKPVQKTEVTVSKAIKRIIRISDVITVGELAKRMGVKGKDLIKELMRQGSMVTINHPLDFETASLLASEFNYEVTNVAFDEEVILEDIGIASDRSDDSGNLQVRPPVVTIMGHVDHGKTSLLDAIRMANVTAGEAGGITQHIGAYDVELNGRKITFLDTPGHEAFTAMRARGAEATDIVILVVAADDGVMPQTKEAINHAKAAGVPIVVAINKIDKADANPDRVRQELTEFEMVPEDWGGDTIFVEVSAKEQTNLDELLEMILLQAEVLELKANPAKRAKGIIVEARLDKGRGPVATVLVQEGTLRVGDPIVSGVNFGRVRTMINDRGQQLAEAGPSCPVEVTGLSGVPEAGDAFHAVENEKAAKDVAGHRQRKLREAELASSSKISLDQLYARLQEGEIKELKVVIKGDVQGSVEAVKDSLAKLSTDTCRLQVIHSAVGGIIESDVALASASDAIILGFNVRPEPKASAQADSEGVDIRLYNIIYDAVEDVRNAMEGLLAPIYKEKHLGRVEVRETFHVSKVGTIAGCYVTDGKVVRGANVRLVRDNIVVWEGRMSSLKRFKDDAREVASGYECGISLENFNDIKIGDVIEAFEMEAIKASL